jgi:hypothetical protein
LLVEADGPSLGIRHYAETAKAGRLIDSKRKQVSVVYHGAAT